MRRHLLLLLVALLVLALIVGLAALFNNISICWACDDLVTSRDT
jgi:hypothetical protein